MEFTERRDTETNQNGTNVIIFDSTTVKCLDVAFYKIWWSNRGRIKSNKHKKKTIFALTLTIADTVSLRQ